jgi:GntR family transcriptional regulator
VIIDPKSTTPIYRQIVEQVHEAINAGVYRPGEALPSLRALAAEIRVNPNTVQRAYEELDREGTVESQRGLGVFVVDRRNLAAKSKAEKTVAAALNGGVTTGLKSDVSPLRIRELFELAMSSGLVSARRQK